MRISENKLYRYSPVLEDSLFNVKWPLDANGECLVFCSRKPPGMRGTLPRAFVYVYAACVSRYCWMRGRLLGMARIGSLTPVDPYVLAVQAPMVEVKSR